jgi:hypothetical protein
LGPRRDLILRLDSYNTIIISLFQVTIKIRPPVRDESKKNPQYRFIRLHNFLSGTAKNFRTDHLSGSAGAIRFANEILVPKFSSFPFRSIHEEIRNLASGISFCFRFPLLEPFRGARFSELIPGGISFIGPALPFTCFVR